MKPRSTIEQAVVLLARREHSAAELRQKLQQAGHETDKIHDALTTLQQNGLQDDQRFAEAYIRSRLLRGYGELRIRQELKQKGVADDLANLSIQQAEIDWFALAAEVRRKRFGEQCPDDFKDRARQMRFLQYRGFTHDQITESFKLN